jgi:hypothetical protein
LCTQQQPMQGHWGGGGGKEVGWRREEGERERERMNEKQKASKRAEFPCKKQRTGESPLPPKREKRGEKRSKRTQSNASFACGLRVCVVL